MFKLDITAGARDDIRFFRAFEQRRILDAIEQRLPYEPLTPAQNRKMLRPNNLAQWALRIGKYRIFYDVEDEPMIVRLKAVGWKEHNRLFIRGKEYILEDD
jgi:mRNA-degrading endonuclease RelE of RelBE toxin-antitoxin system